MAGLAALALSAGALVVASGPASAAAAPVTPVQPLVLGNNHSLTLHPNGTVRAWGANHYGQLGAGDIAPRDRPTPVVSPTGLGQLSRVVGLGTSTYTSHAVTDSGHVYSWGDNRHGQLGDGAFDATTRPLPGLVKGPGGTGALTGIVQVAGGEESVYALHGDGTVWSWGKNSSGQLGDGSETRTGTPVQVKGPSGSGALTGVVAIAPGVIGTHVLALKGDGTVWTWGANYHGQLGDGTTTMSPLPVQVKGPGGVGVLTGVRQVAAGEDRSYALLSNGTVWAWGYNYAGQLGDGSTVSRTTPVHVSGLSGISSIGAGALHALAVGGGKVWGWGSNFSGQLGSTGSTSIPTAAPIPGLTGVVAATGGNATTSVLRSNGSVVGFGLNGDGQLGDGTTANSVAPKAPLGLPVVGAPALRLVAPVRIGGVPRVKSVLTASAGEWALPASGITRQWYRAGKPIPGATGVSYRVVKKDLKKQISVRVVASRAGYPSSAASAVTPKIKKAAKAKKAKKAKKVKKGKKGKKGKKKAAKKR